MSKIYKDNLLKFFGSDGEWKLREILTALSSDKLTNLTKDNVEYLKYAITDILLGVDPITALDLKDKSKHTKKNDPFHNAVGVATARLTSETVEEAIRYVVNNKNYRGKKYKTVETHYYDHRKEAEEFVKMLMSYNRI